MIWVSKGFCFCVGVPGRYCIRSVEQCSIPGLADPTAGCRQVLQTDTQPPSAAVWTGGVLCSQPRKNLGSQNRKAQRVVLVNGVKSSWQQVVMVFLRGQYWGQSCFMSSQMIWVRGLSACSVSLQMTPNSEEVRICLRVGKPTEGFG